LFLIGHTVDLFALDAGIRTGGCGGGGGEGGTIAAPAETRPALAYVAKYGADTVSASAIDATTGALTSVGVIKHSMLPVFRKHLEKLGRPM